MSENINVKPKIKAVSHQENLHQKFQIHPHPTPNPAHPQEILEIKKDRKTKEITIYTNSQSDQRKAFVQSIQKDKKWTAILEVIEEEFGYARITQAREERAHVLGFSELQTRFVEMPDFLDAGQRQVFAWYYPYRAQIRESKELLANAIFSITGQVVRVVWQQPKITDFEGAKMGNWIVGNEMTIGGKRSTGKHLAVFEIGPIAQKDMSLFVPKGYWRRFLEEAFLPQLLPGKCEWEIRVIVEKKHNQFKISAGDTELRIGINSIVG